MGAGVRLLRHPPGQRPRRRPERALSTDDAELRLELAQQLLPRVLADAATAGFRPKVALGLFPWGDVEMSVWYAPGHRGGSTGGSPPASDGAAAVLAWIADQVQETTIEGDQIHCRVWPVCTDHGLGGHALVAEARAVWWCNGGAGHVIAPVGELATRPA